VVLKLRRELLAALLGDDGERETLVTWAAMLGLLAGGASAVVGKAWKGLRDRVGAWTES
jgi:hypothetical protein